MIKKRTACGKGFLKTGRLDILGDELQCISFKWTFWVITMQYQIDRS